MKITRRLSRSLMLLLFLFPLLGNGEPVDNVTFNFFCPDYNQVMFTVTFSQNRSYVSLVDSNGETLQLPFWRLID